MNNSLTITSLNGYKQNFIDYLDVDDLTLRSYKAGIENFMNYLKDNSINMPTRENIISYRNHLRETYQDNTVNSYMTALRRLFKYLSANGLYEDLTIDVKGSRHSTTPKKEVLSLEQMQNIYHSLTDTREKALFGLMVGTGLRVCEISTALIGDIREYNGETVLFVLGKKRDSKCEYVKLSPQILEDIKNYIGDRTSGYIFTSTSHNNNGGGVTTTSLRRMIKDILRRHGIDKDTVSCHSLRRSFAVVSYETGSSIYDIQQVLHHASINTTTRYLKQVSRDNNKTEYNVANAILGGE